MFWRYIDAGSPLFEKDSIYHDTIFRFYEKIDRLIGEILHNLAQDTTLIVVSDHGFNAFHKAVNLNRWLLENNYLFLKEGVAESKELFESVDWSKTKAYALGFGGIYLNRIGREYYGIVKDSELVDLKQKIIMGLEQLQDPETQEFAVNKVYDQKDIFEGPYTNLAPDLFVGFNRGFRASWQTALGGVPGVLIEKNKRKWSGDHLMDPAFVPGVIFMNKDLGLRNPAITDIAPAICKYFDLSESFKESQGDSF
jgi:predicted AlkP superfamily phosphohydrolase/phosphomutase